MRPLQWQRGRMLSRAAGFNSEPEQLRAFQLKQGPDSDWLLLVVQMYARTLLLQQQQQQQQQAQQQQHQAQQQQQRQRAMLAQQQLFKGGRPMDSMAAFGMDGGRVNPAAMNQGPMGTPGKPNVRPAFTRVSFPPSPTNASCGVSVSL